MKIIGMEMENQLNVLLQSCFQMNSHSDNVAYWLASESMVETEDTFHHKYAHLFPELADVIADFMTEVGARSVRKSLNANDEQYSNLVGVFTDVGKHILEFRKDIQAALEIADMNNEDESRIFLEDFLTRTTILIRQARIWEKKAMEMNNDRAKFDKYFKKFTII